MVWLNGFKSALDFPKLYEKIMKSSDYYKSNKKNIVNKVIDKTNKKKSKIFSSVITPTNSEIEYIVKLIKSLENREELLKKLMVKKDRTLIINLFFFHLFYFYRNIQKFTI